MEIRAIEDHELRLGNICLDANGDRNDIINGWQIDEGIELFGVPLTEEILLKCGYGITNKNENFTSFKGEPYLYLLKNGSVKMSTGIEMYYLHELQNRVFSLTGKELEVNL